MNRNELIAYLAAEIGASKKLVRELFSELQATAIRELKSKGVFSIPGLGKLFRLHRRALRGRNPRAGEAITLPAKTVVKFHVDRKAKDSIATRGRLSRPGGGRTTRSNFKGRRIVRKHGGP
ncbi:MAG TPA: HU family DNA-binding protein, partial [Candidatus Angelobacter sp.]